MSTESKETVTGFELLDILLDNNNRDPIVLADENGEQIAFEQVAVIPYENGTEEKRLYVVLKPIDHVEGIRDDEAVVFRVNVTASGVGLRVEDDELLAIEIFNKYIDLLENATGKK